METYEKYADLLKNKADSKQIIAEINSDKNY